MLTEVLEMHFFFIPRHSCTRTFHIVQMLPLNGLRVKESKATKGMSERASYSLQEAPPLTCFSLHNGILKSELFSHSHQIIKWEGMAEGTQFSKN